MSEYIKYCGILKKYHMDPNEMSSEVVNITDISTCTQYINGNNDVGQSNLYKKLKILRLWR